MPINIRGHPDRSVPELRGHILQGFAVREKNRCERVSGVVESASSYIGLLAGLPVNPVPPVVHVDMPSLAAPDLGAILPDDFSGTEKDRVRNGVLSLLRGIANRFREVIGEVRNRAEGTPPPAIDLRLRLADSEDELEPA